MAYAKRGRKPKAPRGYKLVKVAKGRGRKRRPSARGASKSRAAPRARAQTVRIEVVQRPQEVSPLEGLLAQSKKEVKPKRARL